MPRREISIILAILVGIRPLSAQAPSALSVPLEVDAGTPLRVYIPHRIWFHLGAPVSAILIEPVWSFDRIVLPVGTKLEGRISRLTPAAKFIRVRAFLGGDFTPLKQAEVSFETLLFADGRKVAISTLDVPGLPMIYAPPRPAKKNAQQKTKAQESNPSSKMNQLRRLIRQRAQGEIDTRTQGLYTIVRGPNKREALESLLLSKLPWHPQWYRSGTRFDPITRQSLVLGNVDITEDKLTALGDAPPPDATANVRISQTISSSDARPGDPVTGVLTAPLISPSDGKLILPEGAQVSGKVTQSQRARMLHRGGKLRFNIENISLPPALEAYSRRVPRVQAQLAAAEADPAGVKVDQEGTAKATESNTRFLRPIVAGLIAAKSMDNDTGKQATSTSVGTAAPGNTIGSTLGGLSGFGLFGMALAQGPHQIGSVFGFYGLGLSVYTTVISRGNDVRFEKNSEILIKFGAPPRSR